MNVQFPQRLVSMLMVLMMLFTMNPVYVIAEAGHDHTHESTETPVVTAEEAITVSAVAELVVNATASASYVYAGEEPVAVSAKISGGVAPYEVTLQAVKDGSIVSTSKVTTESASASLSFAPASYGDYELVVLVHDAAHTEVLTSASLAVAEHDMESSEKWAASVAGASVSSNWASSLVSVAKTQVGYTESVKDFTVNNGQKQGYSRYGAWYGAPYSAWNAAFVAFVADYANVPTDALLAGYGYRSWVNGMSSKGAYEKVGSGYAPKAGDIAFLSGSRVAIVESVSGDTVNVIEGDVNGKVARQQYAMSKVVGFGNTALMQGIYEGTATVVPTAAPAATPVPEGQPTKAPTATPKPTATPVPDIEGEMEFVATPVPGPGVTVAPKDDMDILDMMTGDMGNTVEQMAAQATSVPTVFSEAFYAMQAEMQAMYAHYVGDGDVQTFVESLEIGDLHYILTELADLVDYAKSIGLTEYESEALVETEDDFTNFSNAVNDKWSELTAERASHTYADGKITITNNTGTVNTNTGTTYKVTAGGGAIGRQTVTLTISNTGSATATISFDYVGSNYGSCTFKGQSSGSGSASELLEPGASFEMVIAGRSGLFTGDATLTLTNIAWTEAKTSSRVTFEYDGSLGSVTLDGATVNAGETHEVALTGATLVATPAADVYFIGWVDVATGKVLSQDTSYTLVPANNMTVQALFGTVHTALWKVGADLYANLSLAVKAGTKVVLANDGTLTGSHTIPAGVNVLIPYNSSETLCTTQPTTDSSFNNNVAWVQPTAYRTLTMAKDAALIVAGGLSVSATVHNGGSDQQATSPTGPVGFINMAEGSTIDVIEGGNLYAWGYIIGDGSVSVRSGANVYECFQFTDFRGGTATTYMAEGDGKSYRVFPLNQYYVQNVEVPMTLYAGATETSYTALYMSRLAVGTSVKFISNTGAMFNLTSGSVTKRYEGATDRLYVTMGGNGNLSVSPLVMSVSTVTVNSDVFELPINSNITMEVLNGCTINIDQNVAMLPGSKIIVHEGAQCVLADETSFFIYDADQWGAYVGSLGKRIAPLAYVPSRTYNRTEADLTDVTIQIDGELLGSGGYVYTTAGGANVYSTGTGKVTLQTGPQTITYQAIYQNPDNNGGDASNEVEIPINPAWLKNADGSYTKTADPGTAYTSYIYHDGEWVLCSTSEDNSAWTHTYDDKEETTKEPTCKDPGVKTLTCVCGATKTEETPPLVCIPIPRQPVRKLPSALAVVWRILMTPN